MIGDLLYIALGSLCVQLGFQMKTIRPFGSLAVGILYQAVSVALLVAVSVAIGGQR